MAIDKIELAINLINRTIVFEKIFFTNSVKDLVKIKINNKEYYSKIAIVSGFIKGAINFGTLEFDFTEYDNVEQLIDFVTYNKSFELRYEELENFITFIDLITIDPIILTELKVLINKLLEVDFCEFIIYCSKPIINKLIDKDKIKEFVRDKTCFQYQYTKYIELKEVQKFCPKTNNECFCNCLIANYFFCYAFYDSGGIFKEDKDFSISYKNFTNTPRLLNELRKNNKFKNKLVKIIK